MKLQILIPQYEESDEVVKPLLDSIAIQQNVDFADIGIIICNDGSDVFLSDELLNSYPFIVEYHKEPHRGVSATRDACFNYSTADYVMFCDADDMFFNIIGIFHILSETEKGFDSLVSTFVEETKAPHNGETVYIVHGLSDQTFVHGKVYSRQFLLDNNIRWNHSLTIHEDSFFNTLCLMLSKKPSLCNDPFYLWKWRDDSVCRHDKKYMLKTYNNMLDSNEALLGELLSRKMETEASQYFVSMVFDTYYTMNKVAWINQENQEYRVNTERRFADVFKHYKWLWDKATDEEKLYISNAVRSRSIHEGMAMESITISDWLRRIEELA